MNKSVRIVLTCIVVIIMAVRLMRLLNHNVGPSTIQPEVTEVKDSVWTDEYKDQVKNAVYVKADTLLVLDVQKREFADCVTDRFRRLFPKGLSVVPNDTLRLLSQKAFRSCLQSLSDTAVLKWTQSQENSIRQQLKKEFADDLMAPKVKDKYCDCIVDRLHRKYAIGIKGTIKTTDVKSAALACAGEAFKP